jgi:hypothetical protein
MASSLRPPSTLIMRTWDITEEEGGAPEQLGWPQLVTPLPSPPSLPLPSLAAHSSPSWAHPQGPKALPPTSPQLTAHSSMAPQWPHPCNQAPRHQHRIAPHHVSLPRAAPDAAAASVPAPAATPGGLLVTCWRFAGRGLAPPPAPSSAAPSPAACSGAAALPPAPPPAGSASDRWRLCRWAVCVRAVVAVVRW